MARKSVSLKFLDKIENSVNKLPDPFYLFIILSFIVIIASWLGSIFQISVIHPGNGQKVEIVNLANYEGIRRMLTDAVRNFIEFPPLGLVLVTMLGVGVADRVGLLNVGLTAIIKIVPRWSATAVLVFTSVLSHIMGDACVVIMPAVGAVLFAGLGKHPIAGLTAAFTGACGGLSANVILTAIDPLLSGFTDSAAKLLDSSYNVYPTANFYFMFVSTFVVTAVGTVITHTIVEPRLGKWNPPEKLKESDYVIKAISNDEKRGLLLSILTFLVLLILLLIAIIPENGLLRDGNGNLKPFYQSIIVLIMIFFLIMGVVFGMASKSLKSGNDLVKILADSIASMSSYVVLAFAAAQFLAYFNWSNLGLVLAVKGATFLQDIGLNGIWLLLSFIFFSMFINFFVTSASAKWAVISPVFVPMMMILGFAPETTQAAFRIADSTTNIITPLLPYFPIILVIAKKYDPSITLGRLISILFPYSLTLAVVWIVVFIIFILLSIPLGPDTNIFYNLIRK
ncbi:MAG: AbgT family transporter [Candidatus Kapabacteria bacterium]|nr:AbgT family transporter [Candidatus Kapabacteria bacterium]